MLIRAWFVIATLWALLLFWIAAADGDGFHMSGGFLFVSLGPFFVPWLLRLFFTYVIFGTIRRPSPPPRPRVF
jgi:hypothetical protein